MGRKHKICAIATTPVTIETFVIDSMRYFQKKNFEITIATSMTMSSGFHSRYTSEFECVEIKMERGIDLRYSITAIFKLVNLFRSRRFDIVQYSTPNASLYAALAAFFSKVPIRIYCQWGIRYVGFSGGKRYLYKLIEKLTCKLSTHIRPVSYKNMQFGTDEHLFGKSKARVIGAGGAIGVDLAMFDFNKKDEWKEKILTSNCALKGKIIIAFIGRIVKDKGVNELIISFKQILRMRHDCVLLLIGSIEEKLDPIRKDLLKWAKNSENVIFTGHVNNVNEYLGVVDILAHPSYREGFSMVIQQAHAMGIPVVTTDIPGPSEVIKDRETGILVPLRDSKALTNALMDLIDDPNKRIRMGMSGLDRARRLFDRQKMVELIYNDRVSILSGENDGAY